MPYERTTVDIPLHGDRKVEIPKDLTKAEMQYVYEWYNLWKAIQPAPTVKPEPSKDEAAF